MIFRNLLVSVAIVTVLGLAGCSTPAFDSDAIKGMLENTPLDLSNEQVMVNQSQLECGTRDELWDAPNGNVARLTQKGRDLKFTDDIRLNDPEIPQPYTQITGTFPVQVSEVVGLRDEKGA